MKLTFRTPVQKALFELEIQGQLSDGHWENARPYDHWKPWCKAEVLVGEKPGRDFYAKKDNYALTSKELLSVVAKRMLGYARLTVALGQEAAKAFDHLFDCEGWVGIPTYQDDPGTTHPYWSEVRAELEAAFETYDRSPEDIREIVESEESYTMKSLLADLREMKQAMKTYNPTAAQLEGKPTADLRKQEKEQPTLKSQLRAAGMVI